MIPAEMLSTLLLDLGRASRELPLREFQAHAMTRLRREFPFDAVIWAMLTQREDGRYFIHDCYSEGMPDNCGDLLNLCDSGHFVARTCHGSLGTSCIFGPQQMNAGICEMVVNQYFQVMHALCTVSKSSIPQVFSVLTLHRRDAACPFTEDERRLKQYLMPHLVDMVQISCAVQISSLGSSRPAIALADEVGVLRATEPGFGSLLSVEWPDWEGPFLPKPVLAALTAGRERYLGTSLAVAFQRVNEFTLVTVAQRTLVEKLSPREYAVASGFSDGESYKEVARRLQISPATVQHHLRIIYKKLGVSDKGALSKLLSRPSEIHSSVSTVGATVVEGSASVQRSRATCSCSEESTMKAA